MKVANILLQLCFLISWVMFLAKPEVVMFQRAVLVGIWYIMFNMKGG